MRKGRKKNFLSLLQHQSNTLRWKCFSHNWQNLMGHTHKHTRPQLIFKIRLMGNTENLLELFGNWLIRCFSLSLNFKWTVPSRFHVYFLFLSFFPPCNTVSPICLFVLNSYQFINAHCKWLAPHCREHFFSRFAAAAVLLLNSQYRFGRVARIFSQYLRARRTWNAATTVCVCADFFLSVHTAVDRLAVNRRVLVLSSFLINLAYCLSHSPYHQRTDGWERQRARTHNHIHAFDPTPSTELTLHLQFLALVRYKHTKYFWT